MATPSHHRRTRNRPAMRRGRGLAIGSLTGWLEPLGLAALTLGGCIRLYWRILSGRARLDLPAFASALRQAGLSMIPVITLVAVAVGLILANQTQGLLSRLYLPGLALLPITQVVVIELVPVLVGILVAGRAGVALAVRQASLAVTGEMDGLLVQGVDPLEITVAPVLLAMLLMSFAFAVWATAVTFGAAFLWLWIAAGISPALFIEALQRALSPGEVLEVIGKPLIFAVLIALIAAVNGSAAGRDPDSVARAATRTMIGAVVAILVTDLALTLWSER